MDGFTSRILTSSLMAMFFLLVISCSSLVSTETNSTKDARPSQQQLSSIGEKHASKNAVDSIGGVTDPKNIEPGQLCVINKNKEETRELDQFANVQGYTKKKRRVLEGLGLVMSIFQVPAGQTVNQGINEFRRKFPSQVIDANHHYHLLGVGKKMEQRRYGQTLVRWDERAVSCRAKSLRIGIVDTPVEVSRPSLKNQLIQTRSFLSDTTPKAADQHGTAVATLLVGNSPAAGNGMLPEATLFVAEAFRQLEPERVEATTWSVVRALDWLIKEKVQVINLSIGGPQNALLTAAINQTLTHNIPIVAAAGNTGPQGQPMYPAAQEGVIAVTALDARLSPYQHATRGSYIAFSAPGVDIWVPTGKETGVFKTGTSFATPFVTTAVAMSKVSYPQGTPNQIARHLSENALDLGTKGKDDIFGWGLIQMPNACTTSGN